MSGPPLKTQCVIHSTDRYGFSRYELRSPSTRWVQENFDRLCIRLAQHDSDLPFSGNGVLQEDEAGTPAFLSVNPLALRKGRHDVPSPREY